MSIISAFPDSGAWYKGVTHAHTNISDGTLSPEDLVAFYKNKGYHFMAITDHIIYGVHEELCTKDFLVLPGVELHCGKIETPNGALGHHVVGIGIPEKNTLKHGQHIDYDFTKETGVSVGDLIKFLSDNGNWCIYAHPYWHRLTAEEMLAVPTCDAIEVFNYSCQVCCFTGDSESYWNELLWKDKKTLAIASDDTHQKNPDYFGGFIQVKAKDLSYESIMESMMAGHYYASQGPSIEEFYVKDGKAFVTCSPCRGVGFYADNSVGHGFYTEDNELKTSFSLTLNGKEKYVRAVCEDEFGKKAWSQPIWLV